MKIEIKSIWGDLLFEGDFSSIADAVSAAVRAGKSLRFADLRFADLRFADLRFADLSSANLRSADLRFADLSSADLRFADLSSANLSTIKHDFWAVLLCAIPEVSFLRAALAGGKVNGSSYTGQCACLVGTIANGRKCSFEELGALQPDSSRPAERFFLNITEGDTPETNQCSKLAVEWLDEFMTHINAALPKPPAKVIRVTRKQMRKAA